MSFVFSVVPTVVRGQELVAVVDEIAVDVEDLGVVVDGVVVDATWVGRISAMLAVLFLHIHSDPFQCQPLNNISVIQSSPHLMAIYNRYILYFSIFG